MTSRHAKHAADKIRAWEALWGAYCATRTLAAWEAMDRWCKADGTPNPVRRPG